MTPTPTASTSTTASSKAKGKRRASSVAGTNASGGVSEAGIIPPTFVPPAGALKSRKPGRTDRACQNCRRRRVKCDASKPACMSCTVIYKEQCVYDSKPTAEDAVVMQGQLKELRTLLDTLSVVDTNERNRLLADYASNNPSSSASPAVGSISSSLSTGGSGKRGADQLDGDEAIADDSTVAMLSELSFAASGEVEHYGATSFLHRPSIGGKPSPSPMPAPSSVDSPSRASLSAYYVQEDLQSHLLDIFFLWQTVHCFVYKPAFIRDLASGGPLVNDFLLMVIFAHAARFSDRSAVQTSSSDVTTAGGIFLLRAKELLQAELDKPSSIPTAQGLLILGGRECACGNHSQGFLYTAMGLSMAIDLGVHVDGSKLGGRNVDAMEAETRRRLFWSCYVWDKSISLCLGRAPRFLKGDRSVFKPEAIFDKSEDSDVWRPVFTAMPDELQHYPFFPFRTGLYFEKIVEDILHDLYTGDRRSSSEHALERFNLILERWLESLHPDLLVPATATVSPPPNRITLSMLYNATIILVNRPFSFRGWGPRITLSEDLRSDAKLRCQTAANEIARLLELYASSFKYGNQNWLMGYCSYMAATIIVFDVQGNAQQDATRRLEIILSSLSSQTTVTPSVQRSIETIRHLMTASLPASGTTTPRDLGNKRSRGLTNLAADADVEQSLAWALRTQSHAPPNQVRHSDPSNGAAAAVYRPDDANPTFSQLFPPLPHIAQPTALQPPYPLLPEFPEVGNPFSWLEGQEQGEVDWLGSYDWSTFGVPQ